MRPLLETRVPAAPALAILFTAAGLAGGAGCGPRAATDAGTDAGGGSDSTVPGTDAGSDAGTDAGDCLAGDAGTERRLTETGYYDDPCSDVVSADLVEFEPAHTLWADSATKRRWIKLPPGGVIDTSDMDHWVFPIGTQFYKEFTRDGVVVETRLIERTGPGPMDYWMGAFVWLADGTDAVFAPDGAIDALGTPHNVPTATQCWTCHIGEPGRILGFSALQLSVPASSAGAPLPLTLGDLAAMGLLSAPPPLGVEYPAPGDAVEAPALGYLHANCGHCHNPSGSAWPDTNQVLRLDVGAATPDATTTYLSTVGVPLDSFTSTPPYMFRIVAGDPSTSAIVFRMSNRGNGAQMPPLATEIADPTGIGLVTDWILSLP